MCSSDLRTIGIPLRVKRLGNKTSGPGIRLERFFHIPARPKRVRTGTIETALSAEEALPQQGQKIREKDVVCLDSKDSKKTLRWTLYFTGGILVVLGLWAMTYPIEALMSLALYLGIGFVLAGLNHLVPCFSLRGDPL